MLPRSEVGSHASKQHVYQIILIPVTFISETGLSVMGMKYVTEMMFFLNHVSLKKT